MSLFKYDLIWRKIQILLEQTYWTHGKRQEGKSKQNWEHNGRRCVSAALTQILREINLQSTRTLLRILLWTKPMKSKKHRRRLLEKSAFQLISRNFSRCGESEINGLTIFTWNLKVLSYKVLFIWLFRFARIDFT